MQIRTCLRTVRLNTVFFLPSFLIKRRIPGPRVPRVSATRTAIAVRTPIMDARGAARFLFFLHISFFHFFYTALSLPSSPLLSSPTFSHPPLCPLRARHYGHPESIGTMEYKAKGEAERESQKRGNRRQVIPQS